MARVFTAQERVKVRDAHNLRGEVVAVVDEGHIALVRFDRNEETFPQHVEELEPEKEPCPCPFCQPRLSRRPA